MTTTYQQAIEHGVARVEYVLHVGGLPWFATTHKDVLTALASDTTTRRAMLGGRKLRTAGASNVYLADTIPGYVNLLRDELGPQTWRLADDEGRLSGGDWGATLGDVDGARTWPHSLAGESLWGLPGLTCYSAPESNETTPMGILLDTESVDTSSFRVSWLCPEDVAALVDDRIDDDGYAVLWAGHEAIAVNAYSGTYPEITYDVAALASADGRGLYRTRPQIHWSSSLTPTDTVISADPGHPVGRHVYVWGVVLQGGAVVDYALEREGVISNVTRTGGRVRLSVNSPLSCLRETVATVSYPLHLRGYSFTRGSASVAPDYDDWEASEWSSSTFLMLQAPHLVIHELYQDSSGDYAATTCPVWLCPVNGAVYYPTWEDLVAAINAELDACYAGTSTNGSGNGHKTVDYTDTEPLFGHWQMRHDGLLYEVDHEVDRGGLSAFAQGPIAILFRTGTEMASKGQRASTITWEQILTSMGTYSQLDREAGWEYAAQSCWIYAAGDEEAAATPTYAQAWKFYPHTVIGDGRPRLWEGAVPEEYLRPAYYYQADWRYVALNPTISNIGTTRSIRAVDRVNYWTTAEELHVLPGSDISALYAGVQLHLGGTSTTHDWPVLISESGGVTGSGGADPYVTPTAYAGGTLAPYSFEVDSKLSGGRTLPEGRGLWYSVAWSGLRGGILPIYDETFGTESTVDISDGGVPDDGPLDPWQLDVRNSGAIITETLGDMIRLLMGEESEYGTIPAARCLHWVPFFVDEDPDFVSFFDYASLESAVSPLAADLRYELDTSSDEAINIDRVIADEFVYHRVGQVLEYDASSHRWRVRFRKIGPANTTHAVAAGRVLDSSRLTRDQDVASDVMSAAQRYSSITINIPGSGEPIVIRDTSSRVLPGAADVRDLEITPRLSRSPTLESRSTTAITALWSELGDGLLRYLLYPVYEQAARCVWPARFRLALGRELVVTRVDVRHPYTGAHGIAGETARVTSVRHDLSKATLGITYDLAGRQVYGWAPACEVLGGIVTDDHITLNIATDTVAHRYSASSDRADAYWFDCLDWDPVAGSLTARSCSCSDYRVIAVELDQADPEWYEFTASIDTTAGTLTLTEVTPGEAAEWDDEVRYVLIYGHWDDVESCQRDFVYAADAAGVLGADDTAARRWV